MKHCDYCGEDFSDEMEVCPKDGKRLRRIEDERTRQSDALDIEQGETVSVGEQRFWERMTFRQFAVLMVRLQAVWILFNAVLEATYLTRYYRFSYSVSSYSALSPAARLDFSC